MGWFSRRKPNDDPKSPEAALDPLAQEPNDERYLVSARARDEHWAQLGAVDSDVIAYLISPEFSGAPAWPTTRQSYKVVRTPATVILASDGMSDPFTDPDLPDTGFGAEVYLETPALVGSDFTGLRDSWEFSLLENFAANVANIGGITGHLENYGVVSMEMPTPPGMPQGWVTDRDTVGVLIGLASLDRPAALRLPQGQVIQLVPVTLITPAETQFILDNGASGRLELAKLLDAAGVGVVSDPGRSSVV